MLEKQTEFGRAIKEIKKREGAKCVNGNREQVMFFFLLKFLTRFSSVVFVQSNHYFRGNAHAFSCSRWAIFPNFQRFSTFFWFVVSLV